MDDALQYAEGTSVAPEPPGGPEATDRRAAEHDIATGPSFEHVGSAGAVDLVVAAFAGLQVAGLRRRS